MRVWAIPHACQSTLGIVGLFNFIYSTRWEVVFNFGFNLHFPNHEYYWLCFHVLCWWSHLFFKKKPIFLNWGICLLLSFVVSSYVIDVILYQICIGKQFHVGTTVFFKEQMFYILRKSVLSIYHFSLLFSSKYFLVYFVIFMSRFKGSF